MSYNVKFGEFQSDIILLDLYACMFDSFLPHSKHEIVEFQVSQEILK